MTGDIVPGADGDHLLKDKMCSYITEEDTYVEDGALVLRNQKRPYEGESPAGQYDYTTGTVISMHRVHLNRGYVEARAQWPSGNISIHDVRTGRGMRTPQNTEVM